MKKFKQFLSESSTANATNMEQTIVDIWNDGKTRYSDLEENGKKIVEFLRKDIRLQGKAVHMGSGKVPISSEWKEWGGTDGTPKTDLIIGNKRISLKKEGGSQLMSAKQGEATATVKAAIKAINFDSTPIVQKIEDYLHHFIEGKSQQNISAQKEGDTVTKDIIDAEKMHKEFQDYLRKVLNTNENLKIAMVFEAMTGDTKFVKGSEGRADNILVFGKDGTNNKFHSTDDPRFLKEKASRTRTSIGWKSVSSRSKGEKIYTYYSAFRLSESIEEKIDKEFSEYNGQLITEGIFSNIVDKVKNWFKNVWSRIKDWLSQSFLNVLSFFGLEPSVDFGDTQF